MFFYLFSPIVILHLIRSLSTSYGAEEVPHAGELSEILANTVFKNSSSDLNTYFGTINVNNSFDFRFFSENLEFRKLDLDTVRKIIAKAVKEADHGARRAYYDKRRDWEYENYNPIYYGSKYPKTKPGTEITTKLLNLMKQSIYLVRDRVQVTKPYRLSLDNDVRYRIGVLIGIVHELMQKLDNVYATLKHLNLEDVNFIYFLLIYERFLTLYIDITNTVENVFKLHRRWALRITTKKRTTTTQPIKESPKNVTCDIPAEFDKQTDELTLAYHAHLMANPDDCLDATADQSSYDAGKRLFKEYKGPEIMNKDKTKNGTVPPLRQDKLPAPTAENGQDPTTELILPDEPTPPEQHPSDKPPTPKEQPPPETAAPTKTPKEPPASEEHSPHEPDEPPKPEDVPPPPQKHEPHKPSASEEHPPRGPDGPQETEDVPPPPQKHQPQEPPASKAPPSQGPDLSKEHPPQKPPQDQNRHEPAPPPKNSASAEYVIPQNPQDPE